MGLESKQITRRQLVKFGATSAVILGAGVLGVGCATESIEHAWEGIPAEERIRKLQFGKYPEISKFDPDQELIKATAELASKKLNSTKKPDELIKSVIFASDEQFIETAESEIGTLDPKSRQLLLDNSLEITTKDGKIAINKKQFELMAANLPADFPEIGNTIKGRDFRMVLATSVLLHAFAHAHQTKEQFGFNKLQLPGMEVNKFEGFVLSGRNGNNEVVLPGAHEAMTDIVGFIVNGDIGPFFPDPKYQSGAELINTLNQKAGITPQEFITYYTGSRPSQELFSKWASINGPKDAKFGLFGLAVVAYRVEFPTEQNQKLGLSQSKAIEVIERHIGPIRTN